MSAYIFTGKTRAIVLLALWSVGSASVLAEDAELSYFGQHLIVSANSQTQAQVQKEYPGRLHRKSQAPLVPSLANVRIELPAAKLHVPPAPAERLAVCGKQSNDTLTVCLAGNALPDADQRAALAFMSEPTVVVAATDAGERALQNLINGDQQRSAHTEFKRLSPDVCSGECVSRIQLVRK